MIADELAEELGPVCSIHLSLSAVYRPLPRELTLETLFIRIRLTPFYVPLMPLLQIRVHCSLKVKNLDKTVQSVS